MVYPDGHTLFESRDRDDGGIHIAFDLIKSVGEHVKKEADYFLREHKDNPFVAALVTVDFHPFHEIERKSAPIYPYRCLSLNDEEKEEFWRYFSAP